MKRVLKYIGLAFAASLAFSACDRNLEPEFNDKDAFVAFDKTSYTVSEDYSVDGDVYRIPVTLASASGLEATIKFEITYPESKAAQEGVNYELVTTAGVLSFDAEQRTRYIEFRTLPDGAYTGDLKFFISLSANEEIGLGSENSCTVLLSDIDHPLGFLFGTYTNSGEDNWDGDTKWTMTIGKDDKDDYMVWFTNLANQGDRKEFIVYGNVNDEKTSINIPFGQAFKINGKDATFKGVTPEGNLVSSGATDVAIVNTGGQISLDFGDEYGFAIGLNDGSGYYAIIWPGMSAVKN